ncbi:MFS transporter [Isoptericola dokdonensis]|uniref:Major Facilitator Superfamily protein n=1 Tax=Isoptericola dokdonensis DS-3 TaxID=1300344 RepID=A0A161IMU5_9MICO|nr:MFS transporter [Isoptericola dokdonensis]ANC31950.1 Major Facilitator Superfamily protein [Isoptericola dokdonensis DS-3]
MNVVETRELKLPRPYLAWLAGVTVSQLGSAVLMFALGWAAAGLGGTTAAMVLTLNGLPRVVLLVVGGAVADRAGARRLLIVGEATLLVLTATLALTLARFGTPTWLLIASSLALGTVTAFCLPATGSMPRRLVPDDQLSRALALRQSGNQAVLIAAAPLGGLLVGTAGLPAIAWGDVLTFGVSLCVLLLVRELSVPSSDKMPDEPARGRTRLELLDGFRVVRRTPALGEALLVVGVGAALMLPVPSLLVPLIGRASDWGPGVTGVVSGSVGVGMIGAALRAARRRTPPAGVASSESIASPAGTVVTALAVSASGAAGLTTGVMLAAAHGNAGAVATTVGALVFGFGNGMFVARMAPLVLGTAPRTHPARVQALVGLVQLVPVMVTNTFLGALAEHTSPGWALGAIVIALAACTIWARRISPEPREAD